MSLQMLSSILLFLGYSVISLYAGPRPNVGPISVTVSDLARSVDFYTRVLDFRKIAEREKEDAAQDRSTRLFAARVHEVDLQLGQEVLRLVEYENYPGRPVPLDSRSNDRWFQHVAIVVSDMDLAYARLRKHQVRPSSPSPQLLPKSNPAAGGIRAFYFRDPDQHALELIWFPADKGNPRWQHQPRRLFQGIDHTAIVVRDTDESLKFYREQLGLVVTGTSHNFGPEQARLNRVPDAELRITGLRGASGPGVEFLEYLHPRDGRPTPRDAQANDLWHWEIHLSGSHPTPPERRLDPDGHTVVLEP